MKSLSQKIKQCAGLIGTKDVTAWESDFLQSVVDRSGEGADTTRLSEKQAETVDRIYGKHFAQIDGLAKGYAMCSQCSKPEYAELSNYEIEAVCNTQEARLHELQLRQSQSPQGFLC